MKIENIWKYLFLIGIASLMILLVYLIVDVMINGNDLAPDWVNMWMMVSLVILFISSILAAITNFKEMIENLNYFLKS